MCVVRKVALRQAVGQLNMAFPRRRPKVKAGVVSTGLSRSARLLRPVMGSPVIWKELRAPILGRRKVAILITVAVGLILLFITYALCSDDDILDEEFIQVLYAIIFLGLGELFTVILPATCVTSEKESRSWPLLLATTLGDWHILLGKFAGILRRLAPIWTVLFGHVILFTLAGIIHPLAVFHMGILVAWLVTFLVGSGLYFSARFRRTTTAVIANFVLVGVIWVLVPILTGLIPMMTHKSDYLFEASMTPHPLAHVIIAINGAVGRGGSTDYYWPSFGRTDAFETTAWMLVCMAGYMLLGLIFAWRAKCRFRRNIF